MKLKHNSVYLLSQICSLVAINQLSFLIWFSTFISLLLIDIKMLNIWLILYFICYFVKTLQQFALKSSHFECARSFTNTSPHWLLFLSRNTNPNLIFYLYQVKFTFIFSIFRVRLLFSFLHFFVDLNSLVLVFFILFVHAFLLLFLAYFLGICDCECVLCVLYSASSRSSPCLDHDNSRWFFLFYFTFLLPLPSCHHHAPSGCHSLRLSLQIFCTIVEHDLVFVAWEWHCWFCTVFGFWRCRDKLLIF